MSWNAVSAFVLDQIYGYQSANKLRENAIALACCRFHKSLGGSRTIGLPKVAAAQDAIDYIDIEVDGLNLGGFTKQARVEVRTLDAGTSVTPRIRNVTDATDAGVGVSCTAILADYSGANQKQTITLTIASGVKKYRLQATPGNAALEVFAIGQLEIFASA